MLCDKTTNVTLFSLGLNFHLRDSLGREWQFGSPVMLTKQGCTAARPLERLISLAGMNRDSVTTVNWRSTAGQDTSPWRVASGDASVGLATAIFFEDVANVGLTPKLHQKGSAANEVRALNSIVICNFNFRSDALVMSKW